MERRLLFLPDAGSTTAVRTRIAAIELLDVKLGSAERAARGGMRTLRTQVALIGRVAAPFPQAAPETANQALRVLCCFAHQSSPIASPTAASWPAPAKSLAQRVATYGDSSRTASRRRLRLEH